MVAALGSVVDARAAKPASLARRRLFRKIHPRWGDFGKFFGFFSEIFLGRRRSPFCGAGHGANRRRSSRRDAGNEARSADRGGVTVASRIRSRHLVKPNTSMGFHVVHRPIDGPTSRVVDAPIRRSVTSRDRRRASRRCVVDGRRRRRRSSSIHPVESARTRRNACIRRRNLFRWCATELRFRESKVKK